MRVLWTLIVAATFTVTPAAFAAPETFFGEDLNPGTQGDDNPPLATHPTSDTARDAFYLRLVNGVETEDFEGQTTGAVPPMQLHFGPDTADIAGTVLIRDAFYSGHHAISGAKYLDVGHDADPKSFHIGFSAPQSAFGFYATDVGDAGAQIEVSLHHASGNPDTDLLVPTTIDAGSASVMYFGVLDVDDPFDVVTISRLPPDATDGFGFDNMVIARAASVVPVVDAFFLPKRVLYKPNASNPAKSKFVASGFFDTGSKPGDLAAAATLSVGGNDFAAPSLSTRNGRTYTLLKDGMRFTITTNPVGSSKARFVLKHKGDLGQSVPADGELELRFRNASVDGRCVVKLVRGGYKLGKSRGALSVPNLFLVKSKASVPGGGKDSVAIVVGLASNGTTPTNAPDLSVQFGATLSASIVGAQFTKSGDRFLFKGNANGVTSVTMDYARETILVKGKGLDLGTFVQGQSGLRIVVGLGTENRGVAVRVARKGNVVRY